MRRWAIVGTAGLITLATWWGAVRAIGITSAIAAELDNSIALAAIAPRAQSTVVYDRQGKPAFSFFAERRTDVTLDRVSPHVVTALLAIEDRRFYQHHGLDPIRMVGSAWRNVRAGRIVEGASTITQQLARASQLSPVRTYERKIREVLLAARIEERYTKAQILEEYLNTVYFGQGLYGVEAAAHGYFNKPAAELEPHEAALLAALVRSPSSDAPAVSMVRATRRRNLVLRLMREQQRLTEPAFQSAIAQTVPAGVRGVQAGGALERGATASAQQGGPDFGLYFQEEVRRALVALFGSDRVLRGGLRVYSTYDPDRQREAERAVTTRIAQIVKMRPRVRDLQGSFVAMDPTTGDVLALVGGRDFEASSFNRATQARRQAGSAFKPILYAAALERGYSPGTLLRGLDMPDEGEWMPAGEHEKPEYTLRAALTVSSNRAAAQLMRQVGVNTAVYYARRLGIESTLPLVPSLALGTGEVTLLELTAAYTAFANRGSVAAPRLITRVEDAHGAVIYEVPERHTQAISPTTAFLMSSMLSDVVSSGTATGARASGFRLPAAGKTGTTDDYADAWFVGYTPHLVAGVWFGLDRPAPIMRGGFASVVAVPAWGQFMRAATAGARADWYDTPADVEKVAICRLTGARATDACRHQLDLAIAPDGSLLAGSGEPSVYEDWFPLGAVPADECPLHVGAAGAVATAGSGSASPMVDAILQPVSAMQTAAPAPSSIDTGLVVDRVLGADGVMRMVMRRRN